MDLHDALLGRRTVQRLNAEVLPREVLERALWAAHHAPNHKLTWPWRFVIPGPATHAALSRVIRRLKAEKRGLPAPEEVTPEEPPLALVVIAQVVSPDPDRAKEDYAACAVAAQNLMLALYADGWGTKWGTGPATRHPEAREILALEDAEEVVGFIWVGREATPTRAPARPPLDTFVRRLP